MHLPNQVITSPNAANMQFVGLAMHIPALGTTGPRSEELDVGTKERALSRSALPIANDFGCLLFRNLMIYRAFCLNKLPSV